MNLSKSDLVNLRNRAFGNDITEAKVAICELYRLHKHFYLNMVGTSFNFYRGRVVIDGVTKWETISEMVYRHPNDTNVNRLNLKHDPVMYASMSIWAIINEIPDRVRCGDRIQIISFNIIPGNKLHCCYIGELSSVFYTGVSHFGDKCGEFVGKYINERMMDNSRREEILSQMYVDKVIADILSDPMAADCGYVKSSYLGNLIFHDKNQYDAVFYPSVKGNRAMNVAFRPDAVDRKLSVVGCCVIRVDEFDDFGFHNFTILQSAKGHYSSCVFDWDDCASQS